MKTAVTLLVILAVLGVVGISQAQTAHEEEITLSTYYPAPYGEYEELQAERFAVGSAADMPNVNGVANFAGLTNDPVAIDSKEGDIYYNSNDREFRYRTDTNWKTFGGNINIISSGVLYDTNCTHTDDNFTDLKIDSTTWKLIILQGTYQMHDSGPAGGIIWRAGDTIYASLYMAGQRADKFEVTTTEEGFEFNSEDPNPAGTNEVIVHGLKVYIDDAGNLHIKIKTKNGYESVNPSPPPTWVNNPDFLYYVVIS